MSRRILTNSDLRLLKAAQSPNRGGKQAPAVRQFGPEGNPDPGGVPKPEEYTSKVIKLIPAEVVAVFITIDGIVRASNSRVPSGLYWGIFAALIIGTYFYVLRITQAPLLPASKGQAFVAALSFAVWVFALGGPFSYATVSWYDPIYGALLLPLYTFAVPLIYGKT